jgi:membrane protein DedA with SNARE-associated domain
MTALSALIAFAAAAPADPGAWTVVGEVERLLRANVHLVEPAVFLLGFAESIAFVSLFVPSTVLFLAIGGLHAAAGGTFWTAALAGGAGAFLGDVVSYAAGRYFRDDIHRVWPFSKSPELVPKSRAFFERWGAASIFIGKFLGMLRPFIPVVAGTLQMPWVLFLLASLTSSLMWAGLFLAPGYGVSWAVR